VDLILVIAASLAGLYGVSIALAGVAQFQTRAVQPWAMWALALVGVWIIASSILLIFAVDSAPYALILGLMGMHLLAINNGLAMHGRLTASHHLARLVISIVLIALAFWGLS